MVRWCVSGNRALCRVCLSPMWRWLSSLRERECLSCGFVGPHGVWLKRDRFVSFDR